MATMHVLPCLLFTLLAAVSSAEGVNIPMLVCSWNPGRLIKVTYDGTTTSSSVLATLPRPVAVDYNTKDKMAYWSDVTLKQIGRVDLNGHNRETIRQLSSNAIPDGLAVDSIAQKLFYTDTGNDVIVAINLLDNTTNTILARSHGLSQPRAIVLDIPNSKIFFTDWGVNPYIAEVQYDGNKLFKLVTTGLGWPNGLTLDRQKRILYFCDAKTDKIESFALQTKERKTIYAEPGAHFFDIFFWANTLYFTGWRRRGIISMMASSGGVRSSISSSLINQPAGLHLTPTSTPPRPPTTTPPPPPGNDTTILLCSFGPGRVIKLTYDGTTTTSMILANLSRPVAVDYNSKDNMVYWTDVRLKQIGKVDLNGLNRQIIRQLNSRAVPDGLALDSFGQRLFYTDTGNDVIVAINLPGNTARTILRRSNGLEQPRAIILDTLRRKIFFTDWGRRPYIATASYTGTGLKKLVTTRLRWPNGLALDRQNRILYFCDASTDRIESVSLLNNARKVILQERGAHYFDIGIKADTLYFTGWRRRGNISMIASSGGALSFISDPLINQPAGLHLITGTSCPCNRCKQLTTVTYLQRTQVRESYTNKYNCGWWWSRRTCYRRAWRTVVRYKKASMISLTGKCKPGCTC